MNRTKHWSSVSLVSVAAALAWICCTASALAGEEVREVVADYESYAETDFLRVDSGTVKAKKLGEKGWHLVVEVPPAEVPVRVTLTAEGWEVMRLLPLRGGGGRLVRVGDWIELVVPADGIGRFFLLAPFPEVSVQAYQPKTLFKLADNTPEKAKYPVVDVHVHLRGTSPEARIEVMDAVGVAIAVDSPLGVATEVRYERFEKKYPNRFLILARLDFSTRFDEEFPDNLIAKLKSDVESMGVPGVSEVIDKGSGVYGHALISEPRGKVFVDDERMMPIWRTAARLKLPVLLHVAEPIWFYEPIDGNHEFLHWQARSFRWNLSGIELPSRDEMVARRDRLMEEIPDLVVIGAHMGTLEDDLARLGETLDKYPNFYVEMGVRHVYLGLQPLSAT